MIELIHLAVQNIENTIAENLLEVDYGSFKDTYSKNEARMIEFDFYKTESNAVIFQLLICENFILYQGTRFVIKQAVPKIAEGKTVVSITAYHVMFEFQGHYIDAPEDENDESDEKEKTYLLKEALDIVFRDQRQTLKFTYKIHGDFTKRKTAEVFGQNGIEAINNIAEAFDCVIYPKDSEINFYHPDLFYKSTEEIIRYRYNTDSIQASVSTLELKTAVKAFGKKLEKKDTKNYSPLKPEDFTYSSDFHKEKTWGTDVVGGRATVSVKCKFGNETIRYTIKKGPNGGLFDAFIDGQKIGTFSCWAKDVESKTIDLKKNVSKGVHSLEFVFIGADPEHAPPKKKKARFLVGTSKRNVINLIANLRGEDLYSAVVDYKAESSKRFGVKYASTLTNDNISDVKELEKWAAAQIQSEPKTELEVNYISKTKLTPRDKVFFVHETMGYNTELKVIRLERGHPLANSIDTVSFSNNTVDMVQIQRSLNKRLKKQDNLFNYQSKVLNKIQSKSNLKPFTTETIGSVLDDED
ncbi:prophage endopeptidase tail family protein [Staphylococcus pseudintermedius]|uniref:prophage endopeptidase tail family protein n=1 Tax=Staphylococcus pseudintermedius TaxID=283734 RepID=UPI0010C388F7|nr:prophage endopeptidase tail family protein [Staphylococcus pseudintermedius]AZB66802.1 tail fiber protein [Staphylococcus phage phiSP119-2]MDE9824163.1 prophage endopeptidase tail family protein [Staphylococcus pseudintermedius]MDE9867406.1 prophage endopeptidase tail family protein [Staphylococcus pseudintermedius]MDE9868222.1 prophage endopeptidase tail family protein [Staphylococcus pseudintermedius]MDE9920208.1 prophage endopeptidase tail family protein [Staphylococcus pseudintermedius]